MFNNLDEGQIANTQFSTCEKQSLETIKIFLAFNTLFNETVTML